MGLSPILHEQRMQELDLPRRFRTIYAPFCSFLCVIRREEALEALRRFHRHLEPGGQLLIAITMPSRERMAAQTGRFEQVKTLVRPEDGATIRVAEAITNQIAEQLKTAGFREVFSHGDYADHELGEGDTNGVFRAIK